MVSRNHTIRRMLRGGLLALAGFVSCTASAMLPESGWWWNKADNGQGYNIEIQNNTVFFSAYSYDANGAPVWYVSGGQMQGDNKFAGTLNKFTNGACFTCPARTPTSESAGVISIHFTAPNKATLGLPGKTVEIERFDFDTNVKAADSSGLYPPDHLLGEWAFTWGATFGVRVTLKEVKTVASGGRNLQVAYGVLSGYQNTATAYYEPTTKQFLISIFFENNNEAQTFTFNTDSLNAIEGKAAYLVNLNSNPQQAGTTFSAIGSRTKSRAYVITGTGPALIGKNAPVSSAGFAVDRSATTAPALPASTLADLAEIGRIGKQLAERN